MSQALEITIKAGRYRKTVPLGLEDVPQLLSALSLAGSLHRDRDLRADLIRNSGDQAGFDRSTTNVTNETAQEIAGWLLATPRQEWESQELAFHFTSAMMYVSEMPDLNANKALKDLLMKLAHKHDPLELPVDILRVRGDSGEYLEKINNWAFRLLGFETMQKLLALSERLFRDSGQIASFKNPDYRQFMDLIYNCMDQDKEAYIRLVRAGLSTTNILDVINSAKPLGHLKFVLLVVDKLDSAALFIDQSILMTSQAALVQLDDNLEHELESTDSVDIPYSLLKLPYPHLYLKSNEHFPCSKGGAKYDGVSIHQFDKTDETTRSLEFVFYPYGRADDTPTMVRTRVREEEEGLDVIEALRHNFDDVDYFEELVPVFEQVIKILLFMNVKQARVRDEDPRESLEAQLKTAPRKKKAYLKKQIAQAHRTIHISRHVETDELGEQLSVTSRSVSPHMRRGHFRHVAHGPGRTERKLTFIPPTLVNADKLAGTVQPKDYQLGR